MENNGKIPKLLECCKGSKVLRGKKKRAVQKVGRRKAVLKFCSDRKRKARKYSSFSPSMNTV